LSSLAVAGVSYKNKLDVDEDYNSILDKYEKEAKNIDIKEDISLFLKKYPTQSSFFYAFSDIPKKREKITMIMNELDIKQREEIEKKEEKIVNDINMTADEKKREIALLSFDAPLSKQKQLNQKIKNFDEKTITDEWVNTVKECLRSCNNESDLERIDSLFKKLDDSQDIIRNREVENQKKNLSKKRLEIKKKIEQDKRDSWMSKVDDCLKNCQSRDSFNTIDELLDSSNELEKTDKIKEYEKILVTKKSEILNKIEEEEKRKKLEEDKSNILSKLEDASTINEVIESTLEISEEFFEDEVIHTKLLNTLKEMKKDEFQTEKGKEHFKALEVSGSKDDFHSYLTENIVPFMELKEEYEKLLKRIAKVDTLNDFNSINFKVVKKFEAFEQSSIKEKLDKKMDEIYDDIYDGKPSDKFETDGIRNWLNKIKKLDNFRLDDIEYSYGFNDNKKSEIKKIEDRNNKIKEIKQNGVSYISVALKGMEDNSLHFECGMTIAVRTADDVTIEGFSSFLDKNENRKCSSNTIFFRNQITLEEDKRYQLDFEEEGIAHTYEFRTYISFSLEELYTLSQGKEITKWIDNNKLELIFER
ncbi:MAG: hypothetical protein GXO21_07250, partial [Aquificae bacterium]|nr:hypothetical protein [Aquificota bacterium]